MAEAENTSPLLIKRYASRRLYNTETSDYVTLDDIAGFIRAGRQVRILDLKTGDDLTRSILLQIILEEESAGMPMFSTQMLAQIIRFYGHTMQGLMGAYLEKNLQGFVEMHRNLSEQTGGLYEGKAFTPEAWTQFMSGQNPVIQNMMSGYLDQ